QFWDTGLRPFFPQLKAARDSLLDAKAWDVVKPLLLAGLDALLRPLLAEAIDPAGPAGMHVHVVRKPE
ncbi:MAG: hypothetical protein AAF561_10760, partial [Planctomycetota bacterium]